jgi:hypothetical protein
MKRIYISYNQPTREVRQKINDELGMVIRKEDHTDKYYIECVDRQETIDLLIIDLDSMGIEPLEPNLKIG